MKKLSFLFTLLWLPAVSQQHFGGITNSPRDGIVTATVNPAELANLPSGFEINVIAPSIIASNNKVGFNDLVGGSDLERLIFRGNDNVNMRIDGEILGPSIAWKMDKWAFAFTTKGFAKFNLVDVDPHIGDAVSNGGINSVVNFTTLSNGNNQRLSGTAWGEIGLSGARNFLDDGTNRLSGGVTLNILFPGSYANFGAGNFNGTINYLGGDVELTNASANLNIAYSGNLGENINSFGDYFGSLFGSPNGLGVDLGVNYQWKDAEEGKYKLNAGVSLRNLGSMTFKDSNNSSTNYALSIQGTQSLNLNQFQDVNSLEEVERILLQSGYLNKSVNNSTDFRVTLPAQFIAYADVKIIPNLYATLYTQQKMKKDEANAQVAAENVTSLTPRYVLANIEFYLPLSFNEISGFSTGIGFRAWGFYIGSSSIVSAVIGNSKQADAYIGYSFRLP